MMWSIFRCVPNHGVALMLPTEGCMQAVSTCRICRPRRLPSTMRGTTESAGVPEPSCPRPPQPQASTTRPAAPVHQPDHYLHPFVGSLDASRRSPSHSVERDMCSTVVALSQHMDMPSQQHVMPAAQALLGGCWALASHKLGLRSQAGVDCCCQHANMVTSG